VDFIETKTIGANVQRNVGLYASIAEFLKDKGWTVGLYYLLSSGHETPRDWPLLAAGSADIILWDGVDPIAWTA